MRNVRSEHEKAEALEHVGYEMNMLAGTAYVLSTAPVDAATRNALLDSFIIHGRSILQFLIPEGSQRNHVLAQQFFENRDDWERARGSLDSVDTATLNEFRRRAHNLVAHVTWDRISILAAERATNIADVGRILSVLYQRFLESKP